jgi:hypothetical protein
MNTQEKKPDNEIGSTVEVRFTNIPGSVPLKGKVDTGADISSLHATEHQIQNGQVTFICKELSHNRITVPVVSQQTVKSADGGHEYRPVIELNVKVNGKLLTGVQFNLNDRGNMSFPVLIGKNILLKGGFKIDPRLDENEEQPSDVLNINHDEDFPGVIHIYKVDKETTDDFVDKYFTQRFAHIHIGQDTYLVRYLGFKGQKLNPQTDADEIIYLMDQINNNMEDNGTEKIQDFSQQAFNPEQGELNGDD